MRAGPYYQTLILHNNAGPLSTAASLHAALAIPNVTLLEAPWVTGSGETDVPGGTPAWPYPEVVEGYALPLEGPELGIEARCTSGLALVDAAFGRCAGCVQALCASAAGPTSAWAG